MHTLTSTQTAELHIPGEPYPPRPPSRCNHVNITQLQEKEELGGYVATEIVSLWPLKSVRLATSSLMPYIFNLDDELVR